jgi:hypothetical protein
MSQQDSGGDPLFGLFVWVVIGGMLLTVVGDVWIHWGVILVALLVSCWAGQSMGGASASGTTSNRINRND